MNVTINILELASELAEKFIQMKYEYTNVNIYESNERARRFMNNLHVQERQERRTGVSFNKKNLLGENFN